MQGEFNWKIIVFLSYGYVIFAPCVGNSSEVLTDTTIHSNAALFLRTWPFRVLWLLPSLVWNILVIGVIFSILVVVLSLNLA